MKMLLLAALLIAGAAQAQSDDPAIAHAKVQVAESLFDSGSARFRDLVSAKDGSGDVCGWVNGKNRFGGYVGYRPFIVFSGGGVVMREEDDSPTGLGIFAQRWERCMPVPDKKAGEILMKLPKLDVAKECNARRAGYPEHAEIYDRCENDESEALAWLSAHPTDEFTARQCRALANTYRSFTSAKQCVYGLESKSWFYMGPRPGTPESGSGNASNTKRYRCTDADGKPYVVTTPTSGCVVE